MQHKHLTHANFHPELCDPPGDFQLDRQLCCHCTLQSILVPSELLLDLTLAVVLHDLGAVADEKLGVDKAIDLIPYGLAISC